MIIILLYLYCTLIIQNNVNKKFILIFRMKRHGICSAMKSSQDKTLLLKISIIGLIISQNLVKSYPSWDSPTTLTGNS